MSWLSAEPLPRATPESQGVASPQVRRFLEVTDVEVKSLHSFMLVRHGHVVAEAWWAPETPEKPHVLWSLSKSFTSTAIGMAVAEKRLTLDDPVLKFFPDEAPAEPSEYLRAMTVRHLLTMSCGHETEPRLPRDGHWVKTFLSHPVMQPPGTRFLYNTPATYMLSAILTRLTGQTVLDYLQPRLFEPLGIEKPRWETSPQGESIGGYGLYLRTDDIAKFGLLYLQKGRWKGRELLPESWVEQATSKQIETARPGQDRSTSDWAQGYGFQFWRSRHHSYRGDGKDGQFCLVLPELDAVIVLTALVSDMQKELNVVWDHLLPAFHPQSLPENPEELEKLRQTAASLRVNDSK